MKGTVRLNVGSSVRPIARAVRSASVDIDSYLVLLANSVPSITGFGL